MGALRLFRFSDKRLIGLGKDIGMIPRPDARYALALLYRIDFGIYLFMKFRFGVWCA